MFSDVLFFNAKDELSGPGKHTTLKLCTAYQSDVRDIYDTKNDAMHLMMWGVYCWNWWAFLLWNIYTNIDVHPKNWGHFLSGWWATGSIKNTYKRLQGLDLKQNNVDAW